MTLADLVQQPLMLLLLIRPTFGYLRTEVDLCRQATHPEGVYFAPVLRLRGEMQIFVKTLTGKTITLATAAATTHVWAPDGAGRRRATADQDDERRENVLAPAQIGRAHV